MNTEQVIGVIVALIILAPVFYYGPSSVVFPFMVAHYYTGKFADWLKLGKTGKFVLQEIVFCVPLFPLLILGVIHGMWDMVVGITIFYFLSFLASGGLYD